GTFMQMALGEARALAERAAELQVAEAHLVLATLEEAAGEGGRALEALRRALYLDPQLITAHVSQARLYTRVGRLRDAQRARANALRYLEPLDPETPMRMEPPTTAGALRAALEAP
ncbi:MAG: protein-glutamate O-methyltransferase CheR, partial [Myxococcus sp.]|nr:protein-glutamate O-methyltransferase CheR [Myxococcus sp.]